VKYLIIIIVTIGVSFTAWSEEPKTGDAVNFKLKDFKFEVEEKEYNVTYKGKGYVPLLPATVSTD